MYFLCAYVLQLKSFLKSTAPRFDSSSSDGVGDGDRGGPSAYPPAVYVCFNVPEKFSEDIIHEIKQQLG
jgi:hypothetical protein